MRRDEANGFPAEISIAGLLDQPLKYGENVHQKAAFYRLGPDPGGIGGADQVQGGPLGFNNIQDASAAFQLVMDYAEPAVAIVKHMNPCGLAITGDTATAYRMAYECDKVSAFGGVVASNRPLDRPPAEQIVQIVTHVVTAPEILEQAKGLLASRRSMIVRAAQQARRG